MMTKKKEKLTATRDGFRIPLHCFHTLGMETGLEKQQKQFLLSKCSWLMQKQWSKRLGTLHQGRGCQTRTHAEFEQDKFEKCPSREPRLFVLARKPDFFHCQFIYVVPDNRKN